ncbi:hypothetical protein NDU88_002403 [Pleurodeles waltl]|uniref:Uncharacterized protein n=1 Tax=Pleurodeles waltl TaxID=8319 RepID=A0AAV7SF44_PLEWA|nr:hypothetical protein NDU88_002403 [Pleurodeles waltl]
MLIGVQVNPSWHLYTPSRPLRSGIKRTISDVLTAAAGVIRLIRLLSHALKTNMAPKATWNPGGKTDGVKTTRVGRDKGEPAVVNKRLTSIAGKAVGKNTLGLVKDAKMSNKIEDSNRETREKELGPPGSKQPQTQQSDQIEQPEHQSKEGSASKSGPAAERGDLHKPLGSPKRWGKITGKDPQLVDWGKDSSDKFYSLTEESDLSSVNHSFSESEDSETSEAGNESSNNEPTVRQLR